jgi:HK97 family phage major capsid protein
MRSLKSQIEIQAELDKEEIRGVEKKMEKEIRKDGNENEVEYRSVFLKVLRGMKLDEAETRALSSNTDADGKALIPQDIMTSVKELRREMLDMYDYVNVETVNTLSGSRVIEKEAAYVPFEGVAELVDIPDMGSPQFVKINFAINDFKGLMEIPNSLLKDTDQNLMNYIAKWIAKKLVATHNALIFYADGTKVQGILGTTGFPTQTLSAKATVNNFKTVFNKDLPSAIAKNSLIITNQTGFDYLDGLENAQGVPYLQPSVTDATQYKFLGRSVVVFDDASLHNKATTGEAPFILGNPKEAYTFFDREHLSIDASSVAGFENDSTKVRAITREDGKFVDTKALKVVYSPVA